MPEPKRKSAGSDPPDAIVDEALAESFPTSDPPSFTLIEGSGAPVRDSSSKAKGNK